MQKCTSVRTTNVPAGTGHEEQGLHAQNDQNLYHRDVASRQGTEGAAHSQAPWGQNCNLIGQTFLEVRAIDKKVCTHYA